MKVEEIIKIENDRKTPDRLGLVHLFKDGNFYRAYDWSAWLMSANPMGEAQENPLHVNAKKLKDGFINTWVGFPVTSLNKFIPESDSINFMPVSDTQIDFTVTLPDDILSQGGDAIRAMVDEWKSGLPLNDSKKNRREEREVAEAMPRVARFSDVLGRILSFPLEEKSPLDAYNFLRVLRRQVAEMF